MNTSKSIIQSSPVLHWIYTFTGYKLFWDVKLVICYMRATLFKLWLMGFVVRLICTFLFTESVWTKRNEPPAKTDSQGQSDLFLIFFGNPLLMGIKCQMTCHSSWGQKCHTGNLWLNLIKNVFDLLLYGYLTLLILYKNDSLSWKQVVNVTHWFFYCQIVNRTLISFLSAWQFSERTSFNWRYYWFTVLSCIIDAETKAKW